MSTITITDQLGGLTMTTPARQIAHEAIDAALEGATPADACPYPFAGQRGRFWLSVYRLCAPLAHDVASAGAAHKGGQQ